MTEGRASAPQGEKVNNKCSSVVLWPAIDSDYARAISATTASPEVVLAVRRVSAK